MRLLTKADLMLRWQVSRDTLDRWLLRAKVKPLKFSVGRGHALRFKLDDIIRAEKRAQKP